MSLCCIKLMQRVGKLSMGSQPREKAVLSAVFALKIPDDRTDVQKQKDRQSLIISLFCCTPSGARTLDPNIKSVVLYQLS